MGVTTGISWTDATWNPIRGCSRVSEGCRHCYAERIAYRFSGPDMPYEGLVQLDMHKSGMIVLPKWNGKIKFVEEHLLDPLRWKKPRRIFVNSMSDLFHENLADDNRDTIFAVMALCPQHTFQVLTKRPGEAARYWKYPEERWQRICERIEALIRAEEKLISERSIIMAYVAAGNRVLPNVHLGVSVEDQKTAELRIPLLLQTPAALRFLSCEPLLSQIYLGGLYLPAKNDFIGHEGFVDAFSFRLEGKRGLHWVIVGGESGAGARPMHPDWARSLRDQCKAAGVPFFFKQWGAWTPGENVERNSGIVRTAVWFGGKWGFDRENLANDEGHVDDEPDVYRIGTKAAGCLLDGVEHHEFPAVSA